MIEARKVRSCAKEADVPMATASAARSGGRDSFFQIQIKARKQ